MKITVQKYKQGLKGLPKEVKLDTIQQELTNGGFAGSAWASRPSSTDNNKIKTYSPTDSQLEKLKKEIEKNVEARADA